MYAELWVGNMCNLLEESVLNFQAPYVRVATLVPPILHGVIWMLSKD
ncbi:hypothetical protein Nmel_011675 [Mimus melanotis]